MIAKLKVGQSVTWSSQSSGSWRDKSGKVIAVVPANTDAAAALQALRGTSLAVSRRKFQNTSVLDRYLVEVPREPKKNQTKAQAGADYYAPLVRTIDGMKTSNQLP